MVYSFCMETSKNAEATQSKYPQSIDQWLEDNKPNPTYFAAEAVYEQIDFVRTAVASLFREHPTVVSKHCSKSVYLPVYQFNKGGLQATMRCNFYNWKLSISSERSIDTDLFKGLFVTSDKGNNILLPVYFEGFPEHLVYGYYDDNHRKFSAELYRREQLYTALFLCLSVLGELPKVG